MTIKVLDKIRVITPPVFYITTDGKQFEIQVKALQHQFKIELSRYIFHFTQNDKSFLMDEDKNDILSALIIHKDDIIKILSEIE